MNNNNNNNNKNISINGKQNRYLMKRVIDPQKARELKYKKDVQSPILDPFAFLIDVASSKIKCVSIDKKIAGYKHQDILKKCFNSEKFINHDFVIQLLQNSQLMCFYCKESVLLSYDIAREMKQWTLDRIDNNQGHDIDNVVISCLQCNLQRRNKNSNAFKFTKQLQVEKMDERMDKKMNDYDSDTF
jgi:hypothetical protein